MSKRVKADWKKPPYPGDFEVDGAKWTWAKELCFSWYSWWPKVDGYYVPKELLEAANEIEDEPTYRRLITYWMTENRESGWHEIWEEQHALEQIVEADKKWKVLDPRKLSPEWLQAVYCQWSKVTLRQAQLQAGADAICQNERIPTLTLGDIGLREVGPVQRSMFSVPALPADQAVRRAGSRAETKPMVAEQRAFDEMLTTRLTS